MDATAGLDATRLLATGHVADLLLGSSAVSVVALLLAVVALAGRRRIANQLAALQTTVTALERAEGRRIVRTISQPNREIA